MYHVQIYFYLLLFIDSLQLILKIIIIKYIRITPDKYHKKDLLCNDFLKSYGSALAIFYNSNNKSFKTLSLGSPNHDLTCIPFYFCN